MAVIVQLPAIHGLDKEKCFPKGPTRLCNYFSVDNYSLKHSKIFKPHLFIPTNEVKLSYQKMAPRFEFIRDLEPTTPCDPVCPRIEYSDNLRIFTNSRLNISYCVPNIPLSFGYAFYPFDLLTTVYQDPAVPVEYNWHLMTNSTLEQFTDQEQVELYNDLYSVVQEYGYESFRSHGNKTPCYEVYSDVNLVFHVNVNDYMSQGQYMFGTAVILGNKPPIAVSPFFRGEYMWLGFLNDVYSLPLMCATSKCCEHLDDENN